MDMSVMMFLLSGLMNCGKLLTGSALGGNGLQIQLKLADGASCCSTADNHSHPYSISDLRVCCNTLMLAGELQNMMCQFLLSGRSMR